MTDDGGQNGATPGLRVLVAGRGAAISDTLRGAGIGTDPAAPADLVLIPEGTDPQGLMAELARHGKALLPIHNASGQPFARADFEGPSHRPGGARTDRGPRTAHPRTPARAAGGERAGLDILAMA